MKTAEQQKLVKLDDRRRCNLAGIGRDEDTIYEVEDLGGGAFALHPVALVRKSQVAAP